MDFPKALKWLPDSLYLQVIYYYHFHKFANLRNPRTFNEKLQWLKLHDRRPEYITMVDKYAVKDYVAGKIGQEFIIPTIGAWDRLEDIDFDALPNQFVLKWNHDSKSVVICSDKSKFDKEQALKKLQHGAHVNGYWYGREWPYKGVKPKIIAEQYISQDDPRHKDLTDYKFFCFDGEPKYVQIIQDRREKETVDFFDMEWMRQDFVGLSVKAVTSDIAPEKPAHFEEMKRVAAELSKGIPFSRIDLYDVKDHVYFGEVTLFPASGLGAFRPDEWNKIIGEMVKLPGENGGYKVLIDGDLIKTAAASTTLIDYKFMCFNGHVKSCFVCTGRFSEEGTKITFYDNDWNILPFERNHPREKEPIQKPYSYEKMKWAAEVLSKDLPFARIDFYEVDQKPLFGEITLYPGSGLEPFQPEEWDMTYGSWIDLKNVKHKR